MPERFRPGQMVKCRVLSIDPQRGSVDLSIKDANLTDEQFALAVQTRFKEVSKLVSLALFVLHLIERFRLSSNCLPTLELTDIRPYVSLWKRALCFRAMSSLVA